MILALCLGFLWAGPGRAAAEGVTCLWLLWSKDQGIIDQVSRQVKAGKPFHAQIQRLLADKPGEVRAHADCLETAGLESEVKAALEGLNLGQTSVPFAYRGGWAMLMPTTEEYRQRGKIYFDQGNYAEAEPLFKKDLELHPASAATWHLLALSQGGQGKHAEAIVSFDKALEWRPNDARIMNDKAASLDAMGRKEEALDVFRQAYALDRESLVVMNNLAWALAGMGRDLDLAVELATKAARLNPSRPQTWDTLGQVQVAAGHYAPAVAAFQRSLLLSAEQPEVRQRLLATLAKVTPEELQAIGEEPALVIQSEGVFQGGREEAAKSYYIQVASYRKESQAVADAKKWKARGVDTKVRRWDADGKVVWYRLLLGPYADREKAKQALSSFQEKGLIRDYMIVPNYAD